MRAKLAWSVLVATACLFGATTLAAKATAIDSGAYTTKDAEYYLTPEQLLFIRPGLVAEILDVTIPADGQLEVTFSITDPAGLPLDNTGVTTPGPVDFRFTLANIPMGEEQKVRLAYERDSRNGTLTTLGNGVYKYKFDYVMDSDPDTTHTLVLGFRRNLREFGLDRYAANDMQNWVPSGMYDPVPRDIVTTETCNRCHDPLALHGSRWREVQACTQCHNAEGNTRFEVLIHAVHAATEAGGHDFSEVTYPVEDLNDCGICHTGGTPTENFPMVATPAAALVCDYSGLGETTLKWEHTGSVEVQVRANADATGKVFARGPATGSAKTGKWVRDGMIFDLYDLATMELIQSVPVNTTVLGCISDVAPGAPRGVAGAQHTNWMDHPSRAVCGAACHDIDFASGEDHIVQTTDGSCYFCHQPTGKEFGLSVAGAHQVLYKSAQFPGVLVKLVGITDTDPGDTPTVTFTIGNKFGPINPADVNRVRLVITGPNTDFTFNATETIGDNAVSQGDGVWAYTFETPLPMDATGSYSVSVEGRDYEDIVMGDEVEEERTGIESYFLPFAVTDATAMPRRIVVDDAKCESCHGNLSGHGDNRRNTQSCTTCHNPTLIDIADPAESVNHKWMVHKIHRGVDLENGYVVIRSRGTYDFSDKTYPGDLRNCEACHVNGSEQLPLPEGVIAQITPNFWWDPIDPVASACLGCHDSDDAAVHAFVNTSVFGESCSTCHGEGKTASVDRVHAR